MVKYFFQRVINNATLMTWANHITIFAHGLLVTPLIVIILSKDEISVWFLLQTLVGLGLLADAGFGFTLSRAVAFFYAGALKLPKDHKEYNEKLEHQDTINYEKLNNLLSTASRIYLIVSLIFIIFFIPIGMAVVWNVMSLNGHDVFLWTAFGVNMAGTFIILQKVKWAAFMSGTKRVGELYRFNTIIGLLKIIGFTLILTLYPSVLNLSIYLFIESVLSNLFIRYKVIKWFKANQIELKGISFFDKEIFVSLWTATWKLGLTTWGNYLTVYGTSLIISQAKDTALIANFLFTQKILGFLRGIAEAPFQANVPNIYGLMARKNNREAKNEISKQLFVSINLLLAGFLFIGIFGNGLLRFLDIDIRFIEGIIFFIFALSIFLDSHATMQGTVYISTNHIPFMIPALVSGSVIVLVGFWILPVYGLFGLVMLSLLVGLMVDNWYSTYLSLRLLNWNFFDYLSDIYINGFYFWRNKIKETVMVFTR